MASLVFSLSGGQTRAYAAYALESGDVITDINNLAQWDITRFASAAFDGSCIAVAVAVAGVADDTARLEVA